MPKVSLDPTAKMETLLYGYILGAMDEGEISQTDLADEIGISQQMLSYKLKKRALTIKDLLKIFGALDTDDETLITLMRGRK